MLGGATEVEARAAAFGGDEAECCAADTKGTKDQGAVLPPPENGEQRTERAGAKRQTFHGHGTRGKRATGEAVERRGMFQENTKSTKNHEDTQRTASAF